MTFRTLLSRLIGPTRGRGPVAARSFEFESLGTREVLAAAPLAVGLEFVAEVARPDAGLGSPQAATSRVGVGIQVALGDGSVRFVSATVNVQRAGAGTLVLPTRNSAGSGHLPELEGNRGEPVDAVPGTQVRQVTIVQELAPRPVGNGDDVVVDGRIITAENHDAVSPAGGSLTGAAPSKVLIGLLLPAVQKIRE